MYAGNPHTIVLFSICQLTVIIIVKYVGLTTGTFVYPAKNWNKTIFNGKKEFVTYWDISLAQYEASNIFDECSISCHGPHIQWKLFC